MSSGFVYKQNYFGDELRIEKKVFVIVFVCEKRTQMFNDKLWEFYKIFIFFSLNCGR